MTNILTTVLGLSALASLVLCFLYVRDTHAARSMRMQVLNVTMERQIIMAMRNDLVEYSKKNPAILPILQSVSAPNPAPVSAPGKPAK